MLYFTVRCVEQRCSDFFGKGPHHLVHNRTSGRTGHLT